MKLLLHQCCGPCSLYPIKVLKEQGYEISGYFYNPNIHPVNEFYKRLENTLIVNNYFGLTSYYDETYGLKDFFQFRESDKAIRCLYCYKTRLKKTVEFAKENNFKYFTSSLLYSKYQNHQEITNYCYDLSVEYNIEFLYYDFRVGWKEGINLSKDLNIYRQQYCGCIYSEEERYKKQLSQQLLKNIENRQVQKIT
ncbi:MAG: epoxyqueuosine reductase QueH [Calditerrivibrio sp.]|nr:epoxyqueuosine reductase QueH [Calditerrivibrio sp.]